MLHSEYPFFIYGVVFFVNKKIIAIFATIKQYKNKTLNKYSNINDRR